MNGKNTYFVKNTATGSFQDLTTLFDGLAILKVDGFLSQGKPVNIYTAQWLNSQTEDFLIADTKKRLLEPVPSNSRLQSVSIGGDRDISPIDLDPGVYDTGEEVPVVIRENVDIEITFCVRQKYAKGSIDVLSVHDAFKAYMTKSDVWIKSKYAGGKTTHCICLKEYTPTSYKLQRGLDDYILGTITLHSLGDFTDS